MIEGDCKMGKLTEIIDGHISEVEAECNENFTASEKSELYALVDIFDEEKAFESLLPASKSFSESAKASVWSIAKDLGMSKTQIGILAGDLNEDGSEKTLQQHKKESVHMADIGNNYGTELNCGCVVYNAVEIMNAGLGTSCSDCYDRMSDSY